MLSPDEIALLADSEQDMNLELRVIVLFISRVLQKPPLECLDTLRNALVDVQNYSLGME